METIVLLQLELNEVQKQLKRLCSGKWSSKHSEEINHLLCRKRNIQNRINHINQKQK